MNVPVIDESRDAVRGDSESDLKFSDIAEGSQENDAYNNNILYSTSKASGVGDTPDLISDETPPLAILDVESDSDLFLFETNNTTSTDISQKGEETVMASPNRSILQESSSNASPISLACETSCNNDVVEPDSAADSEEEKKNEERTLSPCIPLNDPNQTVGSPISSSHQTEMANSDGNQNGESLPLIIHKEQGNDADRNNGLDMDPESITRSHFPKTPEQITKYVIKTEDEVPSTEHEKEDSSNTEQSAGESGAVSAPEVERQADASIRGEPAFTESIHIDESYDARVLLLQQQEECPQRSSHSFGNQDQADSWAPHEVVDAKPTGSSSKPSSSRGKDLSSERKSRKVEKENNHRRSNRKQSNSATRKLGKSPIRTVEVYDRITPVVKKKTSKQSEPTSPYQCKVFPIHKVDPGPRSSFLVNAKQRRILDKELSRGLENEKRALVQALTEYYNKDQTTTQCPSSCLRGVDDDLIISNGSQRETYMSWVLKENHRESVEEPENNGSKSWNPFANVFRKNVYTQVSSKPSFTEKAEETNLDTTKTGELDAKCSSKRIRLVGVDKESDIFEVGRKMYHSLKSLQKAIHLSDFLCFRNNVHDPPLGESLSQPGFQQFMESENEIEVLENMVELLGIAKDDVQTYLKSLEKANLVTESESGLIKIVESASNNNDPDDEDDDDDDKLENKSIKGECAAEESQQIVPFTCPSCQSHMDLEISNPRKSNRSSRDRLLPKVCAFLGEPGKIALNSYFKSESKSLTRTVLCHGHVYEVQFSAADSQGFAQGIVKAKGEYFGQPSPLTLNGLLCCIHHSASYINTRICCSETWVRSSKRHMLESIGHYLERRYRPSTNMNRLRLYIMERKLKKVNVFAGAFRNITEELLDAVTQLHFCMKKSRVLLNKRLKEPDMPGIRKESNCALWENMASGFSGSEMFEPRKDAFHDFPELITSVEQLFEKLKATIMENGNSSEPDDIHVPVLLEIVSRASQSIEQVWSLGKRYQSTLQMPGNSSKRALEHIVLTLSQLGFSKEIQFESLVATFLSCVDKLVLFEEFICDEKVEVRARLHTMCLRIIQKFYEVRTYLCILVNWSIQLARNSYRKIKEINEIKRIKKLKRSDKHLDEKFEFLGGSDDSLRSSVH